MGNILERPELDAFLSFSSFLLSSLVHDVLDDSTYIILRQETTFQTMIGSTVFRRSPHRVLSEFLPAIRQMPGDLCIAPQYYPYIQTELTDLTLGASDRLLETQQELVTRPPYQKKTFFAAVRGSLDIKRPEFSNNEKDIS